jgi:sulfonate transport system permease protein
MKVNKGLRNLLPFLLPILILILWHIATVYQWFSPLILPSLGQVGLGFKKQIQSGALMQDLLISLFRVLKGYTIGAAIGILMGVLMGMKESIYHFFYATITFIRQIPIVAWIPLIIVWAGIGETSKVIIIAMATFFTVLVNTMSGIKETNQEYLELATLYNLTSFMKFRKIYLKSAIPSIFIGLRLGLGIAWMAVVAAELIGAQNGIGYRISDARALMRSELVIICMLVIGLLGLIMDKILRMITKQMTPWVKHN